MKSLLEKSIRPYLNVIQKRYPFILLAVFLSVLVSGFYISKLEIKSGFEDLLPQNNIAVQILKRIPEKVGGAKYLKIAITTDNPEAGKRFVADYAAVLKDYPEIQFVRYQFQNQFFKDHFLQYLPDNELEKIRDKINARVLYEKKRSNPFYFELEDTTPPPLDFLDIEKRNKESTQFKEEGYFITDDEKVLYILARPKGFASNISYSKRLLRELNGLVASLKPQTYDPSIKVYHLGPYYSSILEYNALIRDMTSTAAACLLILLLMFYLYFRRIRSLAYIIIAPVVGVVWTFGLTYFMIGHINSQTAFLAAILLGLVVDFSIHFASRFYEERDHDKSIFDALEGSLIHTGYAVSLAGISTILAFACLIFSDFVGFWQFGLIASVGVFVCVLANFILFPCLVFWLEKEEAKSSVSHTFSFFALFAKLVDSIRPSLTLQRVFLYGGVAIIIACAFASPQIEFEYDLKNLKSTAFADDYLEDLTVRLGDVLGHGTTPSAIFLTDGLDEVEEIDATLRKMQKHAGTTIRNMRSVYSVLPRDVERKKELIGEIKELVDRGEKYLKAAGESTADIEKFRPYLKAPIVKLEDIPENFLVEFRDTQGELGSFVFVYSMAEHTDMKGMVKHAAEIRAITSDRGKTYYASGEGIIFSDMLYLMRTDGRNAIVFAFILIFFVVLFQTRRVRDSLAVLAPLYVGTLLICGTMVLFDLKLNFFNIIIFPLIIGIGVDDGIHIFSRFRELGYCNVSGALRSVGRAVVMTSLTTMVGFSSLLFAKNLALNSMGVLAMIGVIYCLITSLTFLPAMLSLRYRCYKNNGKAEESDVQTMQPTSHSEESKVARPPL